MSLGCFNSHLKSCKSWASQKRGGREGGIYEAQPFYLSLNIGFFQIHTRLLLFSVIGFFHLPLCVFWACQCSSCHNLAVRAVCRSLKFRKSLSKGPISSRADGWKKWGTLTEVGGCTVRSPSMSLGDRNPGGSPSLGQEAVFGYNKVI